tara:strand:+ start:316 stop:984 length:669 start_codon:yes stop_codon:yes gene_type:complete
MLGLEKKWIGKVPPVADLIIVDDFLPDPWAAREEALVQEYIQQGSYGVRSKKRFDRSFIKDAIEILINRKISLWSHGVNACYQYCESDTPLIWHKDEQDYAGALYLSPDPPLQTGTSFWRSKVTGEFGPEVTNNARLFNSDNEGKEWFWDRTKFELVDRIGNKFNRLAIWNAKSIHSATSYMGKGIEEARLFQVFFFEVDGNIPLYGDKQTSNTTKGIKLGR